MTDSVKIPEHICICGYKMDAVSSPNKNLDKPVKDDISMCAKCGRVFLFNKDLTQRTPTEKEMDMLKKLPSFDFVRRAREIIYTVPPKR